MTGDAPHQLEGWYSSPEYESSDLKITTSKFSEISDILLERPNLNSTHLFRADILYDSTGRLQTVTEKERAHQEQVVKTIESKSVASGSEARGEGLPMRNGHATATVDGNISKEDDNDFQHLEPYSISGFSLTRTVVRRLIPRKPQVDRPLEQSCFVYVADENVSVNSSIVVAYVPHVASSDDMPWYHPQVRALMYRYDPDVNNGMLTIYYKLFSDHTGSIPSRTHRTLLALLQTFVRLCKMDTPTTGSAGSELSPISTRPVNPASLKDTILPQHIVQDTYTRLKQKYASDLIARWVEKTDPSKHVFEDIAIAAFLIELWKTMYSDSDFPGFIDIACGNGVLVYILIKEGYAGQGFDARRRKTWDVLDIDGVLEEALCIPRPFLDVLTTQEIQDTFGDLKTHNGIFNPGIFIVSNHADELTVWTSILAMLSDEHQHLPFLAIPCCSHALSGARHRYSLKDVDASSTSTKTKESNEPNEHPNPASGDLKALRAEKVKAGSHSDDKSAYACLTKKTVALAEELGFETEMTLMRIPSTRNIGIVGNRHLRLNSEVEATRDRVTRLLQRECSGSGGIEASAKTWIERARKLVEPQGRGKVNRKGIGPRTDVDRRV